jgi:sodium transport system ATP-binding protein
MIHVRNLRKRFGAVTAVDDIAFDAPDGAITGLLGENGAGKTTTLAMICGLMRPDEGSIQVGSVPGTPVERRRKIGALLDHKGLYGRLTARENIAYFGELHGMSGTVLDQRVEDVLGQLGLAQIADRRTAGFSQGERMKVALGRAIVHSPGHLLLDEPTNGLDIPAVHGLREVLRRMRDSGACIVFSSHVLDDVRALCDHVVMISRGRVAATGSERAICEQIGCATLEGAFAALTAPREMAS